MSQNKPTSPLRDNEELKQETFLSPELEEEMEFAFEGLALDHLILTLDPTQVKRKDLLKREGVIKNAGQRDMQKLISQQANGPKFNHLGTHPISNIAYSKLKKIDIKRDSNYIEEELQVSPTSQILDRDIPGMPLLCFDTNEL